MLLCTGAVLSIVRGCLLILEEERTGVCTELLFCPEGCGLAWGALSLLTLREGDVACEGNVRLFCGERSNVLVGLVLPDDAGLLPAGGATVRGAFAGPAVLPTVGLLLS